MRVFVLLASVLLGVYCSIGSSFQQYLQHFSLHFSTPSEYVAGQQQYHYSLQLIQQHNKAHQSFKCRLYSWAHLSKQQFQNIHFTLPILQSIQQPTQSNRQLETNLLSNIPESLDWRESGYVIPAKKQGKCGACWAFSCVAAAEVLAGIKLARPTQLSVQYLLGCSSSGNACTSGKPSSAFELALKGIPQSKNYPYVSDRYNASRFFTNTDSSATEQMCKDKDKIEFANTFSVHKNIDPRKLKELLQNGPVVVAVSADFYFASYEEGIITCKYEPTISQLNHAVTVMGYTKEGHLIVKNSWGEEWGQLGFGVINGSREGSCGAYLFAYQFNRQPQKLSVSSKYSGKLGYSMILLVLFFIL